MQRLSFIMAFTCALTGLAQTSAAQDAQACANEAQRISETFQLSGQGGQTGGNIAEQPGTRTGASLEREEQQKIRDLLQQARSAGAQGDGQRCMKNLVEARTLLRHAGIGSAQPGNAGSTGSNVPQSLTPPSGQGNGEVSPLIEGVPGLDRPAETEGSSGSATGAPGAAGGTGGGSGNMGGGGAGGGGGGSGGGR